MAEVGGDMGVEMGESLTVGKEAVMTLAGRVTLVKLSTSNDELKSVTTRNTDLNTTKLIVLRCSLE